MESLAGRRAATDRWLAWAATRPRSARTIWYHAASVGEALGLEPVIRRIKAARPDLTGILTFTSPSLARWPNPLPAARADFAPAETPGDMARVFTALDPALLVFSRSDLWPEMLIAANRRGVPVAVAGGVVRAKSRRLHWPVRSLLAPLYHPLRFVGALSEGDASRWRRLGVPTEVVMVTGDPRHDQILERPTNLTELRPLAAWAGTGGPILVAGSVEPEDLEPLLDAFRIVRNARPDARLVVVPHDPSAGDAEAIRVGVESPAHWVPGAPAPDRNASVVIVRAVGLLSDLYALASVAYVGGGLGPRGQHATIEPAAYAIPVLRTSGSSPALAQQWLHWVNDPPAARRAGLAARRALTPGASRITANRLLELLG